jgi:hypothetical protein
MAILIYGFRGTKNDRERERLSLLCVRDRGSLVHAPRGITSCSNSIRFLPMMKETDNRLEGVGELQLGKADFL